MRTLTKSLPVVLLVGLLASGCAGGGSAPADADTAAQADTHDHGDGYAQEGRVEVGSLDMFAADYWSVVHPETDLTEVRSGGCPEDQACPSFEILEGDALEGVDPAEAYLPKGATCPGKEGFVAADPKELETSDVEVGGKAAQLTTYDLTCLDESEKAVRHVTQSQWLVEEGPRGPILVVDRWSFEGLGDRLTTAQWTEASA